MFTKISCSEINPIPMEIEKSLINFTGWKAGLKNPKYVLQIEIILLISWHVNPFLSGCWKQLVVCFYSFEHN